MWVMLDKPGSSNTAERIALMRRYLAVLAPHPFNVAGRREFIGCDWFDFLNKNNISLRHSHQEEHAFDASRRLKMVLSDIAAQIPLGQNNQDMVRLVAGHGMQAGK